MIRTGFPLGYLFIYLFLLGSLVVGVALLIRGRRWRSFSLAGLGATICAFVVMILILNRSFDSDLEWNPTIGSDSQVVGTWKDRDHTLALTSDHAFTFQTAAHTTRGTWTRDDWNLYLGDRTNSDKMRFVQFRGEYRLITNPPGDPDTWDGDLGLRRTQR